MYIFRDTKHLYMYVYIHQYMYIFRDMKHLYMYVCVCVCAFVCVCVWYVPLLSDGRSHGWNHRRRYPHVC